MEDWTEKYRPSSLDEVVGNDRALIELRKWANSWLKNIPNKKAVILSGKAGIGKTSSAIALAKDYGWTIIELNTSDARNASNIKNIATFGAINETFDDQGKFISTKNGGRKLIILDEADNLYERIENPENSENDLSDKGGKKAIIETIKVTNQPIVLIVNDYYKLIKGSGDSLRNLCKLIKFYEPFSNVVFNHLRRICLKEGISADQQILKTIADRNKGDIRSAIKDLQSICLDSKKIDKNILDVLGYRDREKDIFNSMREIFKTKNIQVIRESIMQLDADPKHILLWINENIANEYRDFNDLAKGYDSLSKADVFLGRTYRRQNYGLWSYANDIMNGGVATAKTRTYPNDKYNFPIWLRKQKESKTNREIRDTISKKISRNCHNSNIKSRNFLLSYFIPMFNNDLSFAIKMKNKFDFSENEIKYLLGKSNIKKLKLIMNPAIEVKEKIIEEAESKELGENTQQSLFDF